ncbi:hypothetical protein JCM10207_003586 [Rhodosporidiobolus poonsookiae]
MTGKGSETLKLPLVRGAPDQRLTVVGTLHFLALFLPHVLLVLPLRLLCSHLLFRRWSRVVQEVGRPALGQLSMKVAQFIMSRLSVAQARIIFNGGFPYRLGQRIAPSYISTVEVNGIKGLWLARPGTKREDDDLVVFSVHGGGFFVDTGSNAQEFFLRSLKKLHAKHDLQVSVFCLDYHLAPEYKYPSQLIKVSAAYDYLVNTLGISEDKIVLSGDSAGGNLVTAFLLHLARPAKAVSSAFQPSKQLRQSAGAFLISPFVDLASRRPSLSANALYDCIDAGVAFRAACYYTGTTPPPSHAFTKVGLNPLWQFKLPDPGAPATGEELHRLEGWGDVPGVELFRDPYVNPAVCWDEEWWKEAMPGDGKTVVCWGGKEVLADDCEAFFEVLVKADVKPEKLFKPLGVHDWLLHDYSAPGSWKSKSTGPDREFSFGLNSFCDFLERIAGDRKKSAPASVPTLDYLPTVDASNAPSSLAATSADAPPTFAAAAASTDNVSKDAPIVVKGEGDVLSASMGDSGVIVEKATEEK